MISANSSLKSVAKQTQSRIISLSKGKQMSTLQEEYLKVIESLMVEKSLDNPFSQGPAKIKEFFREASERWERRKEELESAEV